MLAHGKCPAQAFARQLYAAGFAGMSVRSFPRGGGRGDLNLVLWRWDNAAPYRVALIDHQNRLG